MTQAEFDALVLAVAFRLGFLDNRGPPGRPGLRGLKGDPGDRGLRGLKGDPGADCRERTDGPERTDGRGRTDGMPSPAGIGGGSIPLFSVNDAAVDSGYADRSIVMRTGSRSNPAGAYTGGGIGNKAILGVFGFDRTPLGSLSSVSYTWRNVVGPGGPFYNPPGTGTTATPYVNLVVNFDPSGAGEIHLLVLADDSLHPAISASIGSYSNPAGNNLLTYSWSANQNVLIVNILPNAAPGGVSPQTTVGAGWLDNSYRWSDLLAANPQALLVDAFPNDGGLPAGAVMPALLLLSGDSGNLVRSGKQIYSLAVNGTNVLPKQAAGD